MDPNTLPGLPVVFMGLLCPLCFLLTLPLIPRTGTKNAYPENVTQIKQQKKKYRDPFRCNMEDVEGCLGAGCVQRSWCRRR